MIRSLHLTKPCFGLLLAILFATLLQIEVTAQAHQTTELNALACQNFSLRNSSFFPLLSAPSSVVTADFNNDGIPDLVATMPDTSSITIALGNNQTGFSATRDFIVGDSPQKVTVGDFNRDGEVDLAVTTATDKLLNILSGDGEGNFTLTNSYPTGNAPSNVETADLNNDGWLDLVVGNLDYPYTLSIYLGGANGFVLSNPATITLGNRPSAFALKDFNQDGKIDLLTIDSPSVRLFTGDGQGGFSNTLTLATIPFLELTSADFNNDSYPDFATSGSNDGKVRVYLNNLQGGFNQPTETSVIYGTGGIVAGDLNNDGKIDLLTGGFVLLNDGNANFTLRESANAFGNAIADFNGDGIVDLAAPNGIAINVGGQNYPAFRVSYGLGNAQFEAQTYLPQHGGATFVLTGDFNNDGRSDIASASNYGNQVRVSFQNADGGFSLPTTSVYSNYGTANRHSILAAGDFNNDGNIDLAMPVAWSGSVIILLNNGSGQFTSSSVAVTPGFSSSYPQYIQPGDFNNDGKTDLVVINTLYANSYVILLNNGNAQFTALTRVAFNNQASDSKVVVGDFNSDGKSDLAITNGSNLLVFSGNGDGTFSAPASYPMLPNAAMVRSSDLNSDGKADLVVTRGGAFIIGDPGLTVLLANSNGGFSRTDYALSAPADDIVIGDFDGDAKIDLLLTNSPVSFATLFSGNGGGIFTAQTPVLAVRDISVGAGSSFSPAIGAAADFNQDQKLDLVLANGNGPSAVLYNETPKSPCLTVNDVEVLEGNNGTINVQFTVSLSAAATQTVTVDYRVIGRNARNIDDFNDVAGTLEFAPGTQMQTVTVPVRGDLIDEYDETFQLVLSNPVKASLVDPIGVGTIIDDDSPSSLSINSNVSVVEGSGGTTVLSIPISLSGASGKKVKAQVKTQDITATINQDYSLILEKVFFNPGEVAKNILVSVNPDYRVEPDETFNVNLTNPANVNLADAQSTATIVNDDVGGIIQFSATSVSFTENVGTAQITVSRSNGNASDVSVQYSTVDGTAQANKDFQPLTGTITFGANETSKTISVPIINDALNEDTETFKLTLQNVSGGGTLGEQTNVTVNIQDDDPLPGLSVSNYSVAEGNNGLTTVNFSLNLLAASGRRVSINYATQNGSATSPDDYSTASGSIDFAAGETSKNIQLIIVGDTNVEPDETFNLVLSNAVNSVIANGAAVITIINDDLALRHPVMDFDGDGKSDISVFRPNDGVWYLQQSTNGFTGLQFGVSTDKIVPADYDGDGKTDIAVYRDGTWYLQRSTAGFTGISFGLPTDNPVPADFDADGKAELAVFRPSDGGWYIYNLVNNQFNSIQFGQMGDIPVVGDYDGDNKADPAVFRNGVWYIQRSRDGFTGVSFGQSTDIPVPADYDGDSKTDVAVFRPENGTWYLLQSTNGFAGVQFGLETDKLVPADYDGDGKADIAVFRSGSWYLLRSRDGFTGIGFGEATDKPIPNAFVP